MDDYLIKVNVFLIFACLLGIVIIGSLMFNVHNLSDKLNTEMQNIDSKFPKCPECPETKCPEMNCPEMKCPENSNCPQCPQCPDCPSLPHPIPKETEEKEKEKVKTPPASPPSSPQNCPTVKEIVSGIFPGRNPNVVDGGRYFNIDPFNTYDGLSSSNFYEQNYKFPINKVLKPDVPLRDYNISGENLINNSIENRNVDTNMSTNGTTNPDNATNLNKIQGDIPVPFNYHSSVNYMESTLLNREHEPVKAPSEQSTAGATRGSEELEELETEELESE
mgnify:CR=1 FL=1